MPRIQLVHWKLAEARTRSRTLHEAGYQVTWKPPTDVEAVRRLLGRPPAAVVIDLSRLPAQGRDLGLALRLWKSTRHVPLVFVGGAPDTVAGIRERLPDATYTSWNRIRGAVRPALAARPRQPLVPASVLDGYSGTPLPKKLGVKPDTVVVLIGAPAGVEQMLGTLPRRVTLRRRDAGARHLTLWFTRRRTVVERRIDAVASRLGAGGLWIIWRKQTSPLAGDLTQPEVRRVGLAHGLVDFKVCAVDDDWSGLRFVRRSSAAR